ncbi:MAG: Cys-Gln thioester bond-forming surface protein [Lachnospiraceae bacterium]|nr:Cys-Gln thioester bond-forming surface protein [Lachnospiraceae bacterium]
MTTRRRKLRKTLAKTLAFSMIMSMMSFHSFADEILADPPETVTETTVTNSDGSETTNTIIVSVPEITGTGTLDDPKTTVNETNFTSTTTTIDENGNKTIVDGYHIETITTDTEAAGTSENGSSVTKKESFLIDTTNDLNGELLAQAGLEEGIITEISEKTEDIAPVTVKLQEGNDTSSASAPADPIVTGSDPKTNDSDQDQEYDQTVITETPREVTATMGESSVVSGTGENIETQVDIGLTPVEQVWNEYKQEVTAPRPDIHTQSANKPEGYDLYYSGYGENSTHGASYKELNSNAATADVLQLQLTDTSQTTTTLDPTTGAEITNGTVHTAYCVDLSTSAQTGWWYKINNLEDAGYYPNEDAENHIRAIVNNGYWGTETGKGSLDYIKKNLKATLTENPNAMGGLTAEDIDNLTEGEAQAATQIAIWHYGNQSEGLEYIKATGGSDEEKARIDKIAAYWVSLTEEKTAENSTDVITAEKFIDEMSLTVGDKVEGHENNTDADNTNDAYDVNLTFSLVVAPSERNDDLIVKVINAAGEIVKIARLAGDDTSTNYGTLTPDTDGNYTLNGLTLVEGSDVEFNLKLEGAQYLQEGVYIYTSQVNNQTSSQTFVGIAGGYKAVDVDMKVNLNFNVEEGTIVKETSWRRTWSETPAPEPETPDQPNTPDEPDTPDKPKKDRDHDDPVVVTVKEDPVEVVVIEEPTVPLAAADLVTLEDPAVPLAVLPMTGDMSSLWMVIAALSGLSLTGLIISDKKKKKS